MINYQHNFKKQFGQNFIKHIPSVLKTVDALEVTAEDEILEIGPGDGRFTEAILNLTETITLVEIDRDLTEYLSFKFQDFKKIQIINSDILEFDLSIYENKDYKVFGALPYNISKPIIAKFLETAFKPKCLVFIIQNEVAEDYAAKVPKATFLSNYASIFSNVEYLGRIEKEYFEPQPKVHGGILKITPKTDIIDNARDIAKFIKIGFRNPRKKLTNSLRTLYKDINWEEKLEQSNISITSRAAELSLTNWIDLFNSIQ
jgi:16S rRNA (adenine1518-N6/adenine1519-N6)-dimethyltransferase